MPFVNSIKIDKYPSLLQNDSESVIQMDYMDISKSSI